VIFSERDLDEVLDSQERMLRRNNRTPGCREVLKAEYARMLGRVKAMLARRPGTEVLVIEHGDALSGALGVAERVNGFLGGGLDVAKMAAVVERAAGGKSHRSLTPDIYKLFTNSLGCDATRT
jgi:hypothetical protein